MLDLSGRISSIDWPEDFHLENGNYQNECVNCKKLFLGHKRRVICKVCDDDGEVMSKKVDEMTPDELRRLADKKEEEESIRVVAEGFLKEDLYEFQNSFRDSCGITYQNSDECHYLSAEKKQSIIDDFSNQFKLILKKGTRFVAYKYRLGSLYWFDDVGYGIEEMDQEWAELNLENIREVPRTVSLKVETEESSNGDVRLVKKDK